MSKEELYKKIGLLKRYEKYIQLILQLKEMVLLFLKET